MEIKALEKNVSLELQLLDHLQQEGEWRSTEELASLLKINTKKTGSLITHLTHKIKTLNSRDLVLKTVRGRGNLLVVKSNKEYRRFRRSIIENTITYKIIFSIILYENSNVTKLSLDNFVSESLIKNKISQANKFLAIWGVKIVTRKKECQFIGEENQIRVMLQTLLWRLYRGEEWPFYQINKFLIKDIIYKFSENLNLDIKEITCNKLAYIFAINYSRFKRGNAIKVTQNIKEYSRLCHWIGSKTQIYDILTENYNFSKDETTFFILELITQRDIYEKLVESMGESSLLLKNTPADVGIQILLKKYNEYFKELTVEQSDLFYKNIYPCHIYADLFSNLIFSESEYYGLNIVSRYVPMMKKTIEGIIASLYIESELSLFLNDKYLLTEYLLAFSEFIPIVYKEKKITILVDTDASKTSEQFLINRLRNRFSDLYNLELITKIENADKDIDFIISTNTFSNYKNISDSVKNFIIHLFPTQREFDNIENYLQALSSKKI
ncbi:helix-turn-helix domain-containing protein [Lactococcus garvieae]|uniref:Helix-turn-helix domain-containing protein n=1 Tax=Lactococcus garvieae TaxID=1363 RepID=A0AA43PGU3_9LACT|nr:helix-turn-helix domain-containing protein [Lactococcus garvieae]MDH7959413.1 helix-turn-helix domain-containing protein [Lactococcus garvieae]BDM76576.1 hypothetical protein LGMS210922A_15210 [Lactococcus garvieae]BDW51844.1 hypothetical protein LG21E68_15190 [Lactococcus garvieae]